MKMATQILGSPCRKVGALGGGARGRKQDINCLMSVRKRVSGAYRKAMRARGTKTPAAAWALLVCGVKRVPAVRQGFSAGAGRQALPAKTGFARLRSKR